MALYHQAAYTVDAQTELASDALNTGVNVVAPAVGMDETGQADEFVQASLDWRTEAAGPLTLTCEDLGPSTLEATVAGLNQSSRLTIDWGDGTVDEFTVFDDDGLGTVSVVADHDYSVAGLVTVVATGFGDQTWQVAKDREITGPGTPVVPIPPDPGP